MKRGQTKYILTGYRAEGIKLYTPKFNNKKRGLLLGFVVLCFVTPCTNWLLLPLGKILNKFPMWLYK